MEVLQTTAKMQHSQSAAARANVQELHQAQSVSQMQKAEINQEKMSEPKTAKINTQEQVDALIEKLNRSLNPFNTSLRFGFDNRSDDFYVSVIDTKSNEILRRFPIERAEEILPKMQEVNGLLFDQKG